MKNFFTHIKTPLWATIITGLVIVLSFFFTVSGFIDIARDTQDKIVEVRIGSVQDALSGFITPQLNNQPALQQGIINIAQNDPTIVQFRILGHEGDQDRILASLDQSEVNSIYREDKMLLSQVKSDPGNSFTIESRDRSGEILFTTGRAIEKDGTIVGVILTTQTLSSYDITTDNSIKYGIILFTIITIVIILVFLQHAKIIDYTTLRHRLRGVDKMKDDFLKLASTELKAPLSVINGYVKLLIDDPNIDPKDKDNIKKIGKSSKQMNEIVEDMVDVVMLEQGITEFDYKKVDPITVCNNIIEEFSTIIKEKDIDLKLVANASGFIKVDEDKFKQIIRNIVSNAVKYTLVGEVRINIEREDNKVSIVVRDSGIGMSDEEVKGLFQKFHRIKNKDTQDIEGTGLGLWITKKLVEDMGGTIYVESTKGIGTHFIVKFPVFK